MAEGTKSIALNRRARHEYYIEESYEAGVSLVGTEVKSLRMGKVNLRDSYAQVENGQVWLRQLHISPYEKGNIFNHDPLRPRRLLLHRRQIHKLDEWVQQKGLTLIPLQLYLKQGRVKVELGVARGTKLYDKRGDIAERDAQRDVQRSLRQQDKEG